MIVVEDCDLDQAVTGAITSMRFTRLKKREKLFGIF